MAIILLVLCFTLIYLNIGSYFYKKQFFPETVLISVLIFSCIFVSITEILSLFQTLNFKSVLLFWSLILLYNTVVLFQNKEKVKYFVDSVIRQIFEIFRKLDRFEKYSLYSILVILILIFSQGILYPPNNWDSMTYHMPRIVSWISHQSVEHYSTNIIRQIYQPPFTEFVILHFNLLSFGDYFSNSVQFFFFVFSLFAVVAILDQCGLELKYKILSCLLLVTIPVAILEASNTKNDIVVSFFILSAIYFAIKSVKNVNIKNYLFLGLSVGLGALTKGTAYIYFAPLVLIFALLVLFNLYKTENYKYIGFSIFALLIFLLINSGHYIRNYKLNNNVLGLDNKERQIYQNQKMTPKLLISNIIKNVGMHIGPYQDNKVLKFTIDKYHSFADINLNNSMTNYEKMNYSGAPIVPTHENDAPNTIHFFLILLSLILIGFNFLKNFKDINIAHLGLVLITMQVILFCLYLKWQPWHSRLHITLFFVSIPLICFVANIYNKYMKIKYLIVPILVFYAIYIILFNSTRPYIQGSLISITDDRYKKYFANRLDLYTEYKGIKENLSSMNYRNIGVDLQDFDYEYPLFIESYNKPINPIHINVSNFTRNALSEKNIQELDCIISTVSNEKIILFNGREFINTNPDNIAIWLYKKK